MKQPNKLTIAITLITYNQQDYVVGALEGIRTQSREPDEVVIADDGSTDNTQVIINEYVKKHNLVGKWRLLLSPTNRGINKNFLNAVDHTTSEVIVGMSGDDISLPNRCELSENMFIKNKNIAAVLLSGLKINSEGQIIDEIVESDGRLIDDPLPFARRGYLGILPVGLSCRRELFFSHGGLPFDVPNEDDQTIYRAIIFGGILCSSARVFKYRVHDKSASSWIRDKNLVNYKKMQDYARRVRLNHYRHWLNLTILSDAKNKADIINILYLKIRALEVIENNASILSILYNIRIIISGCTLKEFLHLIMSPSVYFFIRRAKHVLTSSKSLKDRC